VVIQEQGVKADVHLTEQQCAELLRSLTARDIAILTALTQYRYLDRPQVQSLFFPSPRMAQLRLMELWDQGLIHRWRVIQPPGWRRGHSVLLLAVRGARLLAVCREEDPGPLMSRSQHARAHRFHLRHDLEANGFFIALAAASRPRPDEGLYHWVGEEACRRTSRTWGRRPLTPDGWGRYLTPTGEVIFLLEWDRGTASPSRIEAKATGYLRYFLDRREAELNHVLLVTPGPAREEAVRGAITRVLRPVGRRPRCRFWTTNRNLLQQAGPLGVIWASVGDEPVDRSRLANLPCIPRSARRVADCIGKPDWWERRPGGGEGA
jgi:hypothetical protein